jgi:linoleoyl-CoA desaturase
MDRPWWHILIGALVMTFVMSALFITLLIGTHFSEETEFPTVDAEGRLPHSWAYHALVTSLDWNPTSKLANFMVGGANAHAAHHLFPAMAHVHYVPLTKIIRRTAAEFGLPYNQTTLLQMVASHFRFLKRMGRE